MSQNDVYKILIDYIQEDNRWKEQMNKTVASIETQTKLTNGRMNKIEPVVENLVVASAALAITKKLNWKWIAGGFAVFQFIFIALFDFAIDWLKARFIN